MGSGMQNIRFLRFLILFVAVVLTIFMYASYYSSRSLALPHIRSVKNNNNISNPIALESKYTSSEKTNVFPKNAKHGSTSSVNTNTQYDAASIPVKRHREPTIDVEAPADSDVEAEPALDEHVMMKDQQYQQIVENNIDNSYNTSAVQLQPVQRVENNANKIVDSDVLIPTSNLQKFIENADKILKNLTNSPLIVEKSHENEVKPLNEIKNAPLDGVLSKVSASTGLKNKSKSNNNTNTTTTTKKTASVPIKRLPSSSVDLTQGIPTNQIYESGHLDEEINIEQICPDEGTEIKLLIIITSAQSHQEARLAIRQTWGHYGGRRDVAALFILGRSYNDTLNTALTQENFLYGDLVRGQFIDTYNNLTLKTISALEWVDKHCSRAKFVLKTDDDMFINVPKLLSFLDKHDKEKRIIYGRLAKKWKPIRNSKSKYYVSPKQFSATVFPPFTTGPAYVLSADTIHDLYQQALQQTYLKLEDVFTTGIIAQQLGIRRVHVNEFLNRRIAFNPCNIRKTISVHMIKSNEQFDLWKKLLDKTTKCK